MAVIDNGVVNGVAKKMIVFVRILKYQVDFSSYTNNNVLLLVRF
jgi:hypothetical protein